MTSRPESLGPCLQRIYRIDCNKRPVSKNSNSSLDAKLGVKRIWSPVSPGQCSFTCLISPADTFEPDSFLESLENLGRIIGLHRIKNTVDRAHSLEASNSIIDPLAVIDKCRSSLVCQLEECLGIAPPPRFGLRRNLRLNFEGFTPGRSEIGRRHLVPEQQRMEFVNQPVGLLIFDDHRQIQIAGSLAQ